ncbi:MAG: bacterial Ig-like domain-containing protein [Clostridia bacterium]|nr:bacterial Ig-like domain-containing protein [Clostridia bacterium]
MKKSLIKLIVLLLIIALIMSMSGCFILDLFIGDDDTTGTVSSISVKNGTLDSEYTVGDSIDLSTAKLVVVMSDTDTTTEVNITIDMVSNFDTTTVGSKNMTITYGGCSCIYAYTVKAPLQVTSITIKSGTLSNTYAIDGTLDLANTIIAVEMSDGSTYEIGATDSEVNCSGFDSSVENNGTLTFTYHNIICTFDYTVTSGYTEPELLGIKVRENTLSNYYTKNAQLDLIGAQLTLIMSDNYYTYVSLTADMIDEISPFDSSTSGLKSLTINYDDQTCTFEYYVSGDINLLDGNSTYGRGMLTVDTQTSSVGSAMQSFYDSIYVQAQSFQFMYTDVVKSNDKYEVFRIDYSQWGLDTDKAMNTIGTFFNDNPLFYWMSKSISIVNNEIVCFYCVDDYVLGATRQEVDRDIEIMIADCMLLLADDTDVLDKSLQLHDYIAQRIDYAYLPDGVTPQTADWANNIVGVVQQLGGVCEAYAKTYDYLLEYFDIGSVYCVGVTDTGENHAWNLVEIDEGHWYWVDVTWDDQDTVIYDNFGMADTNFGLKHIVTTDSTALNYLYGLPTVATDELQLVDLYLGTTLLGLYPNVASAVADINTSGDYIVKFAYNYNSRMCMLIDTQLPTAATSVKLEGVYTAVGESSYIMTRVGILGQMTVGCDLIVDNVKLEQLLAGDKVGSISLGANVSMVISGNRGNLLVPINGASNSVITVDTSTVILGDVVVDILECNALTQINGTLYDIGTLNISTGGQIQLLNTTTVITLNVETLNCATQSLIVVVATCPHIVNISALHVNDGQSGYMCIMVFWQTYDVFPQLYVGTVNFNDMCVIDIYGTVTQGEQTIIGDHYVGNVVKTDETVITGRYIVRGGDDSRSYANDITDRCSKVGDYIVAGE